MFVELFLPTSTFYYSAYAWGAFLQVWLIILLYQLLQEYWYSGFISTRHKLNVSWRCGRSFLLGVFVACAPTSHTHTLSHYRLISCLLSPIHYQNKGEHAEKINRSHPIYNWTNRLFMDSHSILSQMGMHTHIYTHGKWFESVLCSKGRRLQQRINS